VFFTRVGPRERGISIVTIQGSLLSLWQSFMQRIDYLITYGPYGMEGDMSELSQMKCTACRGDEPTLTDAEIEELRPQVPDWRVVESEGVKHLERAFRFDNFAQALAFTNKVGEQAEKEGHHPALLTEWGKVTVSWWTHKIGGLHQNDFVMAARTDELSAGRA
jgi:4a-hydroxytetrahydrobiopterin dehydratase